MPARPDPHADRDPELPLDSDLEAQDAPSGAPTAAHRRPRFVLLVAAGGAVGTALRESFSLILPPVSGIPLAIAVINVLGAFLLGLLLQVLSRRTADSGRDQDLRLFAGTGILGGFTTYSALATDTVVLGDAGRLLVASSYALGTLVCGLAAAALGIAAGRRFGTHRAAGRSR